MKSENIQSSPIVVRLRRFVDEHPSQRAAAKALGNESYQSAISNSLAGVRLPSKALMRAMIKHGLHWGEGEAAIVDVSPTTQEEIRLSVAMKLLRDTKNTYRYDAICDDAAIKSVYLQKAGLISDPPEAIEVIVKSMVT